MQVKKNGESALWQMLDLILTQFDGLVAGYQARHADESSGLPRLSRRDLIFLNGNGDPPQPVWLPEMRYMQSEYRKSTGRPLSRAICVRLRPCWTRKVLHSLLWHQ